MKNNKKQNQAANSQPQSPEIALTQALIKIPSITPIDPADLPAAKETLDLLEKQVKKTGATTKRLSFAGGHDKWDYEVDNLYVEWVIGKPEKHICYMGHTDVVPVGEETKWQENPFSGEIKDGFIYGRGATDMKGSVAAFVTAIEDALQDPNAQDLNLRIGMIITTDEEWAAINGTRKVLDWMRAEGKKPDSFIVGEPSSHDHLGSHIKLGRRGSLVGTLSIKGTQGHAAYTALFENPNRAMGLAMAILNAQKWQDGNDFTPDTNFEVIATNSGNFKASAIVPGKADLMWNIRFTTEQTPEKLEQQIKDALANPPDWAKTHPDFKYLEMIEVKANIDTASHPYNSKPSLLSQSLTEAIGEITGTKAISDGAGGTTDGRFIHQYFPEADIVEMGLPERGGITCKHRKPDDYLNKGGMHQIDERASIQDIKNLKTIFQQAVKKYGTTNTTARTSHNPSHPKRRS